MMIFLDRYRLFILLAIIFCYSCGQKSYDELLQENRELKHLISEREKEISDDYHKQQLKIGKGILDSIDKDLYDNFYDSMYKVWSGIMPHNENKFARIHEKYTNKGALSFIEPVDYDEVVITLPTKDSANRYKDTMKGDERNLNFIPKESGLYHWSAEVRIRNKRTKQVKIYRKIDSIYIMK